MEHAVLAQDPVLDFAVLPELDADPDTTERPPARRHPGTRYGCPRSQREGRLVGRSRESALLRDWWTSVRQGAGRLLLVDGDPGIGKTRLVAELARAVEADGALVLWGRCDEDPVAPFQPFAEALGRYFQSLSGGPDLAHARLATHRALPAGAAPARVRSRVRGGGRRSRQRALPVLRGGDGDPQRALVERARPARDRRPARRRPADAVAAPPRAAGNRRRQARRRRDVHRHRGAVRPPIARHGGGLPSDPTRGDRAPAGIAAAPPWRSWCRIGRTPRPTWFPSSAG